ncbi:MAG: hypothetical protein LBC92_04510 [Rickettsiales bacterium]|jgi:hypothetical protein|nr:hypothetical protein [Rickettsiales bacterium]
MAYANGSNQRGGSIRDDLFKLIEEFPPNSEFLIGLRDNILDYCDTLNRCKDNDRHNVFRKSPKGDLLIYLGIGGFNGYLGYNSVIRTLEDSIKFISNLLPKVKELEDINNSSNVENVTEDIVSEHTESSPKKSDKELEISDKNNEKTNEETVSPAKEEQQVITEEKSNKQQTRTIVGSLKIEKESEIKREEEKDLESDKNEKVNSFTYEDYVKKEKQRKIFEIEKNQKKQREELVVIGRAMLNSGQSNSKYGRERGSRQ